MVAFALILAVAGAASAAVALATRRQRPHRVALRARPDPRPAGVKHLAATVSELSDLGLHLPPCARGSAGKPRLGALLGLR